MPGIFLAMTLQAAIVQTLPADLAQTTLCGVVSGVSWTKPAAIIELDVFTATNGAVAGRWKLTGLSPNSMMRAGLTRDSLRPGTLITVRTGWEGKPCAGVCEGRLLEVRWPNAGGAGMGASGTHLPPSLPAPTPASCDNTDRK
jgi:hypothetical protein